MANRLTTPLFGIDSTGEVAPGVQHAIRSSITMRYSSRFTPKAIDLREHMDYKNAGIGLGVVFEDGADNALMGYSQGKSDAEYAKQQTTAAGRPADRPIFFAVDFDPAGDPARCDDYFAGVAAVLGPELSGPYGGIQTVTHLFDKGFKWGWQTLAWSAGELDHRAQVYQYAVNINVGSMQVDYDHAYYHDFGQWGYKPVIVDAMHYNRYRGVYKYNGHEVDERKTAIAYDNQRKHPRQHRKSLAVLRTDCKFLADRIAHEAITDKHGREAGWGKFDRYWRYPHLIKRWKGEKLT